MIFFAKVASLIECASIITVQSPMLACHELATILVIHCVRTYGTICFILSQSVYSIIHDISKMCGKVRKAETNFDYTAAPDDNSVARALVGRPFDVLLASFALLR